MNGAPENEGAEPTDIGGGSSDINFESDEPIPEGKACDLTGDGTCESCT